MNTVTVGNENSMLIDLYYEDHGSGHPVVLVHGFPLNGASWEKQRAALLKAGFRVITYDRRGFGKSSQPSSGYDASTFAHDLHTLVSHLNLESFALAGFSMGGEEVARYVGTFGAEKVSHAIFVGAVTPCLGKRDDNPDGVGPEVFEGIKAGIRQDRFAFLAGFFKNFYNADETLGNLLSQEALDASWAVAIQASSIATEAVVDTWGTDFRADLAKFTMPTLIIHGDADRIVPFELSGKKTHESISGSKLVVIKNGPHGILLTHGDQVATEMVNFLS